MATALATFATTTLMVTTSLLKKTTAPPYSMQGNLILMVRKVYKVVKRKRMSCQKTKNAV